MHHATRPGRTPISLFPVTTILIREAVATLNRWLADGLSAALCGLVDAHAMSMVLN
jgi:hypothetical protein